MEEARTKAPSGNGVRVFGFGVIRLELGKGMGLARDAIAMIDRSFQGPTHVEPDGFYMALETFDRFTRSEWGD
jgi:hypothetical protein